MKESEDKKLEKLVDHLMKGTELESPSFDFTSKVMLQALASRTNEATVYKALIPTSVFIGILAGFIALTIYLLTNADIQTNNWFLTMDLSSIDTFTSTSFFEFSKITTYSVVFTTLILLIQISFLKKYFGEQIKKANINPS